MLIRYKRTGDHGSGSGRHDGRPEKPLMAIRAPRVPPQALPRLADHQRVSRTHLQCAGRGGAP